MRPWILALLALSLPWPRPLPAGAQAAGTLLTQPPQEATPPPGPRILTPGGAFLRSLFVPGWGHARVGAPVRGGFYFASESLTAFMLFKTHGRLARARERRDMMEAALRARLEREGITEPGRIEEALEKDPVVGDLRALVTARSEQREDWIALGVFLLFLGGADAFVSAHLADFPPPVTIQPTPSGGVEVGVSLPLTLRHR